jgi:hypothetical protein
VRFVLDHDRLGVERAERVEQIIGRSGDMTRT